MAAAPQVAPSRPPDGDLRLTHAFVNALGAAYGGLWVFERSLQRLEPTLDRDDEIRKAEQALERVEEWRAGLDAGDTLFRSDERPLLDDDASRAWRLLHVAECRLRSLIQELIESSDIEALESESLARSVRIAAMCESAHANEQYVRGMVRWAEAFEPTEAGAWKQRLLMCRRRVQESNELLDRFAGFREAPPERMVAELLDDSLLLPADTAERVVDICHVFSQYTGVFDYADVGIPDAQTQVWEAAGFDPYSAGRWFAAGLTPCNARDWIGVGADDPLLAAGFMWRGFSPDQAEPWLCAYIDGRAAAAWAQAGCQPEDAREWIALGLRDPAELDRLQVPRRVM